MTVFDCAVPPLAIRLFGSFEVRLHGAPLPRLRTRKGQWLLALLTLRAGSEVERAWLAGTLWPESDEPQALASLRKSLTDLRQALGPAANRLRSPTSHTLSLDLMGTEADVVAFDQAIAQGGVPSLEQAVSLYRGPLLEGCAEEWAFQERQAREHAFLTALERLATHALAGGEPGVAERYLRQAVGVDPLRESAQRGLMQALAAGGNYAAALLTYRELRLYLHRELSAEPDPETRALFQQLRAEARHRAATSPSDGLSLASSLPAHPLSRPLLPEGTVTFLFTDIEGSTRLWEQHPEGMRQALARHDALLRYAIESRGGFVFKMVGDAFHAVFPTAPEALAAALTAQRALHAEDWGPVGPLRVRMALHTGAAEEREGDYFGPTLNRLARLLEAGHSGQILLAGATQELTRDHLPEGTSLRELGEHRLRDLLRPERVFQLVVPDLPADFPPLDSLDVHRHNLPLQLTSFIGRERELAEVKRLLVSTRLLTLTGTGGCGKTRLALQVAAGLVEEYADGIWLVELAALAEPGLVPQTVATVLHLREEPGRPPTETLVAYLRPRHLLLVLDNCEHVVSACAQLAEGLLRACPHLRLLATSRERLGIVGELAYTVPCLSLTDLADLPAGGVERLSAGMRSEAVRLFVDRAVFSEPRFAVTEENVASVAEVCQRLDGIPLAIELAAARVKALPVEKIAQRLEDRFRLLTGGSRTTLPRQQTLRALIDWSYDLLSEPERVLLRRLSVFAGGWTLEAAEAVCAGEGIENWEVLDLLTQLVVKSLVVYEEEKREGRYRLLETVRQYGQERLEEAGEARPVRDLHQRWFLEFAERAEPELYRPDLAAWLDQLEEEHDNLRAALAWAAEGDAVTAGLRLGGALWRFWHIRGYVAEGRERLAHLLTHETAQQRTAVRARALVAAGIVAKFQLDYAAARALMEEGLAIWRDLGDERGIASALQQLVGVLQQQGSDAEAQPLLEEGLTIQEQFGPTLTLAFFYTQLGMSAFNQGAYDSARSFFQTSLQIEQALGDRWGIGYALLNLGQMARRQGNEEQARRFFEEAMTVYREVGDPWGIARCLQGLGGIAVGQGAARRGVRLLGAADSVGDTIGVRLEMAGRDYEHDVAAARTQLDEEAFAAAWAAGRAMTWEQAVSTALGEGETP